MPPPPPDYATEPPPNYGALPSAPPSYNAPTANTQGIVTDQNQLYAQSVVIAVQAFGPKSQAITCPHCRAQISTRVESKFSTKTHLIALFLCLVGLWCCVPCPYCTDSCRTQNHYCSACNAYLGSCNN